MAALQGAMGALSISAPGAAASTSAFWGNPLSTYSAAPSGVIDFCRLRLRLCLSPLLNFLPPVSRRRRYLALGFRILEKRNVMSALLADSLLRSRPLYWLHFFFLD